MQLLAARRCLPSPLSGEGGEQRVEGEGDLPFAPPPTSLAASPQAGRGTLSAHRFTPAICSSTAHTAAVSCSPYPVDSAAR